MTKKEKELLIKDLCSRLPYGVKVQIDLQSNIYPPMICKVCDIKFDEMGGSFIGVEVLPDSYCEYREFLCKPYLFPLSSMTDEQKEYINYRWGINDDYNFEIDPDWGEYTISYIDVYNFITWLNENHFDVNGLITKGLAINATNLNIY